MRSAALAGSLGLLIFLRAGMALAQAAPLKPGTRTISVSGHGEVKAKPDLMIVSFAIDSKAPSGARCTEIQTGKTQKLVDVIKALLGENAKIETSDYSLRPVYEPDATSASQTEPTEPPRPPSIWSYSANVTVFADTVAALAPLIDVAIAVSPRVRVEGSGYRSETEFGSNAISRFSDNEQASARVLPKSQLEQRISRPRPFVMFSIHATAATPDEAVRQGMQIADKLEKSLKAKVGTAGEVVVSIPQFWIGQTEQPYQRQMIEPTPLPQHRIYAGHATVTVKTEKLDLLGALIEAGMKNGADQLNSVSFTLSDTAASDDAAIAAASREAETKARTAANSMAVKLEKILSISVNAQVRPQMVYGNTLLSAIGTLSGSSPQHAIMPVLPRELGVGAEVNAVYEIQ